MKMKRCLSFSILLATILGAPQLMSGTSLLHKDFYYMYISLRKSNAIVTYKMNARTGEVSLYDSLAVPGGPAPMTLSPDNKCVYVGERTTNTLSSFKIDPVSGKLKFINRIKAVHGAVNLEVDKTGRYLLSVYYASGDAAVHEIAEDGSIKDSAIQIIHGLVNPHSIHLDEANRYAFIADKGGDKIYSYHFNPETGKLTNNSLAYLETPKGTEPRHFVFYEKLRMAYFVNETGNTVTSYRYDKAKGILTPMQNQSTLPAQFKEFSKCADILLSRDHRFLYASNRGHNSIAVFSVNQKNGLLKTQGIYGTLDQPRACAIDPAGNFLIAANEAGDNIAIHKINKKTGGLTIINQYKVGEQPSWILILKSDFIKRNSGK